MNANARELAHREQDGLEVTLLWDARSNSVSIEVIDRRDESGFLLPVAGDCALDAFHHPYAYALADDAASYIGSATTARVTS
jgi:YD repeat-containing protein